MPRTLEVWEDMGIASLPDLPYAHLGLPQGETERLLARHLRRLGVAVERGLTVTAMSQNEDGVTVRLGRTDAEVEHATFRGGRPRAGPAALVRPALVLDGERFRYPVSRGGRPSAIRALDCAASSSRIGTLPCCATA